MRACTDHWWVVAQGCLRTADLELDIVRAGLVSCKLNANLGCQHVSQKQGLGPPRMVGWIAGRDGSFSFKFWQLLVSFLMSEKSLVRYLMICPSEGLFHLLGFKLSFNCNKQDDLRNVLMLLMCPHAAYSSRQLHQSQWMLFLLQREVPNARWLFFWNLYTPPGAIWKICV